MVGPFCSARTPRVRSPHLLALPDRSRRSLASRTCGSIASSSTLDRSQASARSRTTASSFFTLLPRELAGSPPRRHARRGLLPPSERRLWTDERGGLLAALACRPKVSVGHPRTASCCPSRRDWPFLYVSVPPSTALLATMFLLSRARRIAFGATGNLSPATVRRFGPFHADGAAFLLAPRPERGGVFVLFAPR